MIEKSSKESQSVTWKILQLLETQEFKDYNQAIISKYLIIITYSVLD